MAGGGRLRSRSRGVDFWPGFVDAMATLLLVVIFLLSIFIVAQFYLSQQISGKDTVLLRLNAQIQELTELLALEQAEKSALGGKVELLSASLAESQDKLNNLYGLMESTEERDGQAGLQASRLEGELNEERQISRQAQAQVEFLNQQIAALRRQLGELEAALSESEARDVESRVQIRNLTQRLNVALARKVQELQRYRSDFFGRLREILSQRADIRVVGDRFVFQSEVLFPSASDEINPDGEVELKKLAEVIRELADQIPDTINWVLRVDGHTDNRPLSGTGRFQNNWELSSARAISVVRYLIENGVDANRLVAAGFGEFQPLESGDDPTALAKNRRIELKLTER